jgi:hypothetical protein
MDGRGEFAPRHKVRRPTNASERGWDAWHYLLPIELASSRGDPVQWLALLIVVEDDRGHVGPDFLVM